MECTELHPIFNKDPAEWMQYVHKEVCVTSSDGACHYGWVYTIDPVSETIVLAQFTDSSTDIAMVLGHSVKSIRVTNSNTETHKEKLKTLFLFKNTAEYSKEDLQKRKFKIKSWLEKNRLPVCVSGDNNDVLSISDALFIEPPYSVDDCRSTNEIILGRIQGLIKNMPEDVQQW
ncbi:unnamed protein product [Owenia fusiformis]|uniref:Gem-associated protein 6 n=1 Tax=Owenia fusiformis TaxID=6347 RepID=A0A8J1UPQ7_OWEFU|nr:unnamed protein product [Owenia fusiformis]